METIFVIVGEAKSLINFRLDMMKHFIKAGYNVVALAPNADDVIKRVLAQNSIKYEQISMNRSSLNFIECIKLTRQIKGIIRRYKPSGLIAFTIKPVIFGSIAASQCAVKNIIPVITGLGYTFIGNSIFKRLLQFIIVSLYKFAFRKIKVALFQNTDNRDLFVQKGIVDIKKTHIIRGSGVNMEHFKYCPLPEEPSFLFIGRLIKDKGIIEFINASIETKQKYPNTTFSVVGGVDKNPTSITQEQFELLKQENKITFYGKQDDVRKYIKAANVVVLPSYSEGTPRSILEGMAMGRAVIVADSVGCRETIFLNDTAKKQRQNGEKVIIGENGIMVDVANSKALADAFELMIKNRQIIKDMAKKSYEFAKKYYDVNEVNADILAQIQK